MSARFHIFRLLVFAGLVVLTGALFRTQVTQGEYYRALGDKNRIRLVPLEAPRGRVYDSAGHLLATNRPAYDVVATPEDVTPEVFPRLSRLLDLSPEKIRQRMSAPREYPFAPAVIAEDVGRRLAFTIEEYRPYLPGVHIRVSGLRYYPYKETASHLIGFIGKISRQEYLKTRDQRDRYGMNSYIGRMGIERIFDKRLRGWRGGRQLEVNARGNLVRVLSEKVPEPGEDLTLTINLEFQERIMELIKDQHAAVAVLDLQSEELLALASSPSYDPNVFVTPGASRKRLQFIRDEETPLLDRGVSGSYPPGSVFKLVTALAGLEAGKITPQTRFHCSGSYRLNANTRPRKCWFEGGHGNINLYEAIERSCNVYFYKLGKRVPVEVIAEYARKLGLGKEPEIRLTNVSEGLVPDPEWKQRRHREKWYLGETLSFAIGQSYLLSSPLQILKLVSIIAKDGERVSPYLIRENMSGRNSKDEISIKKEHLDIIKRGMLKVVQSDFGTGQLARLEFGKMAAKTGSAQAPPKDSHAWMTGFFPYEEPRISFVVFVEHGGSGGVVASRVVKSVIEIWRDIYAPEFV